MPVYEYRCRTCGHQFEIQQSISDDALTECTECRGELRKVFSPVGITFKGSGFYKTDSRSGSSASSGGSSSAGSSSGSSDSSSASSSSGESSSNGSSDGSSGSSTSTASTTS
jgi:putative FmdB family regulatory protein